MKTSLLVAALVGGCATGTPGAQYRADVKGCFFARNPQACNSLSHAFPEEPQLAQALVTHACSLWPRLDSLPHDDWGLAPFDSRAFVSPHPECKQ